MLIEKELYSDCTFKPQINKVSKELVQKTPLDELAFNPKGQQKK